MINYGNRNTQSLDDDNIRSFTEFLNDVTITEYDEEYSSKIEEFKNRANFILRMAFHERIVKRMVDLGVVPALARHLVSPITEVVLITLRALKNFAKQYQEQFDETRAVSQIINFLNNSQNEAKHSLIYSSIDILTTLARTSTTMLDSIRIADGIPSLVHLLDDIVHQRVACFALEVLSTNHENATQIVGLGAVPLIILMLYREDRQLHNSVFQMIYNLDGACEIVRRGYLVEAFHPLTELMSSTYFESQRLAIDLLDLIVKTNPQWKIMLIQRGLIPLLTKALTSANEGVQESSVFLLCFLSEDSDCQVGIVNEGLVELLKVLDTKLYSLQVGAAFTLHRLADNKDNVYKFIMLGGVQRLLQGGYLGDTQAFDLFRLTLESLAEKINGHVLTQLLHRMWSLPNDFQTRIALALAYLSSEVDSKRIFIDSYGLELLTELLGSSSKEGSEAAAALFKLASKFLAPSPATSLSIHPDKYRESFADTDGKMSDVIFLIEGKLLYAHKSRIINASKVLSAMVTKSESFVDTTVPAGTAHVVITEVKYKVFERILRFIYTGNTYVSVDTARELFEAASYFDLAELMKLCENKIAQNVLSVETIWLLYEAAEAFVALTLKGHCIMFALRNYEELRERKPDFIDNMIPKIHQQMVHLLRSGSLDCARPDPQ